MNENLPNDIDDLFKKGLEDHTELPSEEVWDLIDRKLDKKKVVSISRKYNKLKWAAAALLVFSLGMAMYTMHLHMKNKELVERNNTQKDLPGPGSQIINDSEEKSNSDERKNPSKEKLNNSGKIPKQGNQKSGLTGNGDKSSLANRVETQKERQGLSKLINSKATTAVINSYKAGKNLSKIQSSKNNQGYAILKRPHDKFKTAEGSSYLPGNRKERLANEGDNRNSGATPEKALENHAGITFFSTRERNIEGIQIFPEQANSVGEISAIPLGPDFKKMIKAGALLTPSLRNSLHGQSSQKSGVIPRFSATIYFSPDIVTTRLKNDKDNYRDEDRNEIKKDEQNNFSFSTGVLVGYKFSNRITLESGFTFSNWETNIHPKIIYARQDYNGEYKYKFNCSAGYSYLNVKSMPSPVPGDSLMAHQSNNIIQYAGVPIKVKYTIKKGRLSLIPLVGFSANFLIKGQLKTSLSTTAGIQKVASNVINGLKPFYVSGSAGIGAQYAISKRLELAFLPTANFSLTSINKNAPVKTKLYTFGFEGGLVYEF